MSLIVGVEEKVRGGEQMQIYVVSSFSLGFLSHGMCLSRSEYDFVFHKYGYIPECQKNVYRF